MLGEEHTAIDGIREFERTFEQNYHRKMNDEEQRILEAARKIIQERLEADSEKAGLVFCFSA